MHLQYKEKEELFTQQNDCEPYFRFVFYSLTIHTILCIIKISAVPNMNNL